MAVESMDEHLNHPGSQAGVGSSYSLSMREKSQIKRRVNKEHNSNFRAGYININEEYLHKTGIRGRKRYLLYCFIGFLVLIALVNALITAWLVYKFRIYHIGMMPIEFYPADSGLRFMEETDVEVVKMSNALLGGRSDKDLNIIAADTKMLLGARDMRGSKLELHGSDVTFKSDNFTITDRRSGRPMLWTGDERMKVKLNHAKNLHALLVQVGKLKSRQGFEDIVFESHKNIKVHGAEGVTVQTRKSVIAESNYSMYINATKGSIFLDSDNLIFFGQNLPKRSIYNSDPVDPSLVSYKLCVCGNNGRVFGVAVTGPNAGCRTTSGQNPCDT